MSTDAEDQSAQPTPAVSERRRSRFLKHLKRLMAFVPGRRYREQWDEERLTLERRFLAERRAAIERELERRMGDLAFRHPELREAIKRFARDPLPERWGQSGLPPDISYRLRPLRRELDVIDVLEGVISRRRLVDALEGALRRVEEEVMESLQQARPSDLYGDMYWSDELLEQILSHLLHLWADWLREEARQEYRADESKG